MESSDKFLHWEFARSWQPCKCHPHSWWLWSQKSGHAKNHRAISSNNKATLLRFPSAAGVTVAPRLAVESLQCSFESTSSQGTLSIIWHWPTLKSTAGNTPARFVGLLEALQHRLAGAGTEDTSWCAGKEGTQATCLCRAEVSASVWMGSICHWRAPHVLYFFSAQDNLGI